MKPNTAQHDQQPTGKQEITRSQRIGRRLAALAAGAVLAVAVAPTVENVAHDAAVNVGLINELTPDEKATLDPNALNEIALKNDGVVPDEFGVYSVEGDDTVDIILNKLHITGEDNRDTVEKALAAQGTPDGDEGHLQPGSKVVLNLGNLDQSEVQLSADQGTKGGYTPLRETADLYPGSIQFQQILPAVETAPPAANV
ncbi:MAG: hypothetical protein JWN82_498 [Candidatus Saccharibacteria bacterium]|nr:hypothetical protein [Candidatus Saccharibacteria bacterium]